MVQIIPEVFISAFPEEATRSRAVEELSRIREPLTSEFLQTLYTYTKIQRALQDSQESQILKRLEAACDGIISFRKNAEKLMAQQLSRFRSYGLVIGDLNNEMYQVVTPLSIVIEEYQDEIIARCPELNLYASETTDNEAIISLKKEIVSLYEEIEENKLELGPLPASWQRVLETHVIKHEG
jgi:hypothetical protein